MNGWRRLFSSRITIIALLGAVLISALALAAEIPLSERKSGYDFMGRETRAMQDDDTTNPGMLAVLDGEALWAARTGASGKSCADCHGDAKTGMKGVAARYPAFSPAGGRPINLEQRINICRTDQQKATPLAFESKDLLALAAYVGRQSRGMPVDIAADERTKPFLDAGRDMFTQRQGQLNLSCAQCHDDNWGGKLAGAPIPQGHATGYPLYRLEWQLPVRDARRDLCAGRARVCRPRALPGVARARHAGRDAGRAAVTSHHCCGVRWKPSSGVGPHTLVAPGVHSLGRCGVSWCQGRGSK